MNSNDYSNPVPPPIEKPMAAPYDDENVNVEGVEEGLDVAEDEKREAVADAYEADDRRRDPDEIDSSDFGNSDTSPSTPPGLDPLIQVVPLPGGSFDGDGDVEENDDFDEIDDVDNDSA